MIHSIIKGTYKDLDKTFDILKELNITIEFYMTYNDSVDIFYDRKSKKIKTILRKYFDIEYTGYCAGIGDIYYTYDIQKDMVIYRLTLKDKFLK